MSGPRVRVESVDVLRGIVMILMALDHIILIGGHNLLDPVRATSVGAFAPLWTILHGQGAVVNRPDRVVFVAYPLIPWVGVTAAGYGFGQVFSWPPGERQRFLLRWGVALTVVFVLLRFANVYGDPIHWTAQASAGRTVRSFLNATKYPPSLLFLLMTLGPAMLMLRALDPGTPRALGPALTFGRVPLFYFLLHLPLIHLLAVVFCAIQHGSVHWMFESPTLDRYPFTRPPGWGYSLPIVYGVWVGVALALYPLCRWFADVKARRTDVWLSYV